MSVNFFLGIWQGDKCQRYKVENIDFDSKVDILKGCLSNAIGQNDVNHYEFTYCGIIMDQDKPLSTYEISQNGTVYVHGKAKANIVLDEAEAAAAAGLVIPKVSEEIVQNFVSTFRKFKATSNHNQTLQRLETLEDLDKVVAAVPGLQTDPLAIAFISKPEFFLQLESPKICWSVSEKNPLILTAAHYVMTEFHETTPKSTTLSTYLPPSPYSLEIFSDEDEDTVGAAAADTHSTSGSGASEMAGITAAQLAAALASTSGASANASTAGSSSSSASTSSLITSAMLQQALTPFNESRTTYRDQLQQMREMGLNNENHNLRALMAVQGDLQAAVDLVFSGAFDD